jgi:hypothetical protein
MKFPVFNESQKSIKPFKRSRAWSIPNQVNAVYTQTHYFLEMQFYMSSFTNNSSSKNVYIYYLSHSSNAIWQVHPPLIRCTNNIWQKV